MTTLGVRVQAAFGLLWAVILTFVFLSDTSQNTTGVAPILGYVFVGWFIFIAMWKIFGNFGMGDLFMTSMIAVVFLFPMQFLVAASPITVSVAENQILWWALLTVFLGQAFAFHLWNNKGKRIFVLRAYLTWNSRHWVVLFQFLWMAMVEIALGRLWPVLPLTHDAGEFFYRNIALQLISNGLAGATIALAVVMAIERRLNKPKRTLQPIAAS